MINSICLIGNPNCGKTSLFNSLTGSYQKTGNWSGVTTEKKEGFYKKNKKIKIVDLPGLYSLEAKTEDEKAVTKYLSENKPSLIINVLDGTNLERNLYLSCEIIRLGIPVVFVINFYDELQKNKISINFAKLKQLFGVEIIPISAKKNLNIDLLERKMLNVLPVNEGALLLKESSNNSKNIVSHYMKDIINQKTTKTEIITEKLDKVFTHKYFGIPIFCMVVMLTYFLSSTVGGYLSGYISNFFAKFIISTSNSMFKAGFSPWIIDLFTNAVLKGVGSVLAFTPQILILFLLMTTIEESGYATRVTFILDRIFRSFGLGGKSVIPIILSSGCAVTGIMATRTIDCPKEKQMTVYLAPFMPCGAKSAVFAWFSYVFFNGSALVSTSLYFIGLFSIGLFGYILNKTKYFSKQTRHFLLEMPLLRLPSIKDLLRVLWEKVKDFTYKSGTVIFAVSVVLWLLSNFGIYGYTVNVEESFLYSFGNIIKYIFYPLGFCNWQSAISVITGFFAKEAVVETFELLNSDFTLLFNNKFSVYAFMVFVLLSPPCAASISAAKNELKNKKSFWFMLVFQFVAGYTVALFIVLLGKLFTLNIGLIFSIILGIIILSIAFIILAKRKYKCEKCFSCKGGVCQKSSKHNTTICDKRIA
ncbi:MAG: ferrous iron transporter B [Clostridia bacterium]|nr:ferrous iron transporter B [Clostridia bacterium]